MVQIAGRKIFDGWLVVFSTSIMLTANSGIAFYGLPLFLQAVTDEQGLSTSSASLATSIYFIVGALAGRIVAPQLNKRDIRKVVSVGAVIASIGIILIGHSKGLPALFTSYALFSVGTAATGLVPGTTLVTRWFDKRRSMALALASTGLSVGGIVLTPIAARLIERRGLAEATITLSAMLLSFNLTSLIAMWPWPHERGQYRDGIEPPQSTSAQRNVADLAADSKPTAADADVEAGVEVPYEEAIRTPFFFYVTAATVFSMAAQVGSISHIVKLGTERVDYQTGTLLVSLIAFSAMIFRLIGGYAATKIPLANLAVFVILFQGGAQILLSSSQGRSALITATALFGSTIGINLMMQPLLLAERFGVKSYAAVFALSQLINVGLGVSAGPFIMGRLHDIYSYQASYIAAALLSAVAAVSMFLAGRSLKNATQTNRDEHGKYSETDSGLVGKESGEI